MTHDSMRDWPASLRLNAAICALAEEMYRRFCEGYSQPPRVWLDDEMRPTRAVFVAWAETFLKYAKAEQDRETKDRLAMADCYPEVDPTPVRGVTRFETLAADLAREAFYIVPKAVEEMAPIDPRD